ncbi:MAG: DUF3795 domain-containing protein [Candidatus Bathyarchaeota archaeon]|nr:DUF3795 domain-containing protein [Candidatus Bathyarchaeota archaeon]
MDNKFSPELIAPCGMNCGVCKAYLAYSRGVPTQKGKVSHCSGCRVRDKNCAFIKRDFPKKVGKQLNSCLECSEMPCQRLSHLDQHYQARYGMSMVSNLKEIKEKGMDGFLESQAEKYRCPTCGDVVSVHDGKCYACNYQGEKPVKKVGKAQWDSARWVPDKK